MLNVGPVALEIVGDELGEEAPGIFLNGFIISRMPLFFFQAVKAALLPNLARMAGENDLTRLPRHPAPARRRGRRRRRLCPSSVMAALGPWLVESLFGDQIGASRHGAALGQRWWPHGDAVALARARGPRPHPPRRRRLRRRCRARSRWRCSSPNEPFLRVEIRPGRRSDRRVARHGGVPAVRVLVHIRSGRMRATSVSRVAASFWRRGGGTIRQRAPFGSGGSLDEASLRRPVRPRAGRGSPVATIRRAADTDSTTTTTTAADPGTTDPPSDDQGDAPVDDDPPDEVELFASYQGVTETEIGFGIAAIDAEALIPFGYDLGVAPVEEMYIAWSDAQNARGGVLGRDLVPHTRLFLPDRDRGLRRDLCRVRRGPRALRGDRAVPRRRAVVCHRALRPPLHRSLRAQRQP